MRWLHFTGHWAAAGNNKQHRIFITQRTIETSGAALFGELPLFRIHPSFVIFVLSKIVNPEKARASNYGKN
jgi:hypothetical protein